MGKSILVAALGHGVVALLLYVAGVLDAAWTPRPHRVMTARLVRLGPERKPELLPTLASTATPSPSKSRAPTQPPPPVAPKIAPQVPARPPLPASTPQKTQSALERLRHIAAGSAEGDVQGDTDVAQESDRYGSELEACLKRHFDFAGPKPVGRTTLVTIRIQANGQFIGFQITKGSGLPAVDIAVIGAARRCGRISPPPASLRALVRDEGYTVDFTP